MVSISINGVLGFKIKDGAFDGTTFIEFIENVLKPHFVQNPNDILIMDNCKFHHRKDVIEILNLNNITHRFLPPNSPQLNSI